MARWPWQKPRGSVSTLTASAAPIVPQLGGDRAWTIQPWQEQALALYATVGEAAFPADFYYKSLSRVRLFPAVRDEQGEIEETDDPTAAELLNRVQDYGGGRSRLQGSYGRLRFLIGECQMVASIPPDDESETERWEMLSPTEFRRINGGREFQRQVAPQVPHVVYRNAARREGFDGQLQPGEAIAWRLWNPDPAFSGLATSSMRSLVLLFEELILLTRAVRARVVSRLASQGILFLPEEMTFPSEDETEGDEDPEVDVFLSRLIEHINAAISDPGSASAAGPLVVRTQGEQIALVKLLRFNDPNEVYRESGLRDEVIRRIAIGEDLPPEVLMGLADSNHWSGWMVDEQVAEAHLFPMCQAMCDDITAAYYRPAARDADVANWENLVVGYDAAGLVIHPDRSKDAKEVFSLGELGGEALREYTGFDDQDAPTDEERETFVAIKLGKPELLPGFAAERGAPPDGTGAEANAEPPATNGGAPPEPEEGGVPGGVVG